MRFHVHDGPHAALGRLVFPQYTLVDDLFACEAPEKADEIWGPLLIAATKVGNGFRGRGPCPPWIIKEVLSGTISFWEQLDATRGEGEREILAHDEGGITFDIPLAGSRKGNGRTPRAETSGSRSVVYNGFLRLHLRQKCDVGFMRGAGSRYLPY
ncbi:hypothetical protein KM043_016535 [Ampulex compressa]|nr:hypothetical protein KM043_016535 [Ampulex compressa]